ncbi:MAG: isoprenylcysteine carboxylmethyltransferase family protein [Armatimonadetes bacterium]|nr:isoprenylcysteine carboxylmethyltransferase family protein [Armatimonadota bacterium]
MSEQAQPLAPRVVRGVIRSLLIATVVVLIRLGSWGLGDVAGYLANPVRRWSLLWLVGSALAVAWILPPNPYSRGREETFQHERVSLRMLATLVFVLYVLPPVCDRHGWLIVAGDGWRWLGLALDVVGTVLAAWAPYHQGRAFSAFVTLQEDHRLVTDGPFAVLRHPRYTGMVLGSVGVSLIHGALAGVVLNVLLAAALVSRAGLEERLLAAEFGDAWTAYAARTRRFLPGLW